MNQPSIFNFIVQKEDSTITVERSFNALIDTVWAAWTEADILSQWWAPKPYQCVIKSLDLRNGGRWLYYMQGPTGDRHWCLFDYDEVRSRSFYSGSDAFCDEHGVANNFKPPTRWENHFTTSNDGTLVRMNLFFGTPETLEQIIQMGFKEGFTQCMDQLDELLASGK